MLLVAQVGYWVPGTSGISFSAAAVLGVALKHSCCSAVVALLYVSCVIRIVSVRTAV